MSCTEGIDETPSGCSPPRHHERDGRVLQPQSRSPKSSRARPEGQERGHHRQGAARVLNVRRIENYRGSPDRRDRPSPRPAHELGVRGIRHRTSGRRRATPRGAQHRPRPDDPTDSPSCKGTRTVTCSRPAQQPVLQRRRPLHGRRIRRPHTRSSAPISGSASRTCSPATETARNSASHGTTSALSVYAAPAEAASSSPTQERSSRIYPYFVCIGRHQKRNDCTFKAVEIEDVEELSQTNTSNRARPRVA